MGQCDSHNIRGPLMLVHFDVNADLAPLAPKQTAKEKKPVPIIPFRYVAHELSFASLLT